MVTKTISPDEMTRLVRETIEQNRGVERTSKAQASIDRAIEDAFDDNELELAMGMIVLSSLRISGDLHSGVEVLMQHAYDRRVARRAGGNN